MADPADSPANDPENLVWATVHVFHAAARLVEHLQECVESDCGDLDGNPACAECEEASGAFFALQMIAASLEGCQRGHKAIRRASKRLMDKRVAALERKIELREMRRPLCPLPMVPGEN
jgi:hypothetical protein